MKWVSIIPLRAGSKGLENKNIRFIQGKQLYRYTVDFALKAGTQQVYISTDIKEILSAPYEKDVLISERSSTFCQDDSKMSAVILDFLSHGDGKKIVDDQTIVLLQATSPLRRQLDLVKALELFSKSQTTNLMMAVTQVENNALKYGFVVDGTFKHISEPKLCFENSKIFQSYLSQLVPFIFLKRAGIEQTKALQLKPQVPMKFLMRTH